MRHPLLLQALLVGLGCCMLPPAAAAAAASPCSSGSTSESFYAFPGKVTFLGDISIPVCETGRVEVSPVEGFFTPRVRGRRITLNLVSGFPLLGTRCAGPLDVDLGSALPAVTLSLSRVIHGRLRIDLRGAHRFSAHGFSGVVRSTLVLRLGRAKAVPHSQGSPVPTSGQRTRIVNVTYRVQRLRGTAVADIRASSDAAVCGPLDACGLSGTT
jgi:hypothetical protein